MATQQYTIEEVGARIRSGNPEAFKAFTDRQIGERAIQRKPELKTMVNIVDTPQTSSTKPEPRFGNKPASIPSMTEQTTEKPMSRFSFKNPEMGMNVAKSVGRFGLNLVQGAAKTAIQFPRAVAAGVSGLAGNEEAKARFSQPVNVPILGEVKGLSANPQDVSRYNTQTPLQTAGQAAEIATLLPGAKAAVGVVKGTARGALAQTARFGAKQGAKAGALAGFGSSAQQEGATVGSSALGAASGAAVGAAAGAAIPTLFGVGRYAKSVATGQRGLQKAEKETLELVQPLLSPSEKVAAIERGRGVAPSLFREADVLPDAFDREVANAVKGVVIPKKSLVENVNAVRSEIAKEANEVIEYLERHDAIFNTNQFQAKLSSIERPPLLAADNTLNNAYEIAQAKFMEFTNKEKKSLSGLLKARKNFDAWVEKYFPNLYDADNLKPLQQALRDMRHSANDFIAEKLPENNLFRESLRRQSLLFEARGNMAEKAAKEVGKTKAQSIFKKYPTVAKALRFGAQAAGAGVVGNELFRD